jgi:hypothetical protein
MSISLNMENCEPFTKKYKLLFIEIQIQRLPPSTSWIPHDCDSFLSPHRLIVEVVGGFLPIAVLIMEVRGGYLLPRE